MGVNARFIIIRIIHAITNKLTMLWRVVRTEITIVVVVFLWHNFTVTYLSQN